MNWGYKLMIGMTVFIVFIVSMSVVMMNQKVDLVTDSYYQAGLNYDTDQEAKTNAKELGSAFNCQKTTQGVEITFPMGSNGTVLFYRPNNAKQDIKLPIQLNANGIMIIPKEPFVAGLYKVICNWECNGKKFLQETDIQF